MPRNDRTSTHRRIQLVFALVLACVFYLEFTQEHHTPILSIGSPYVVAAERPPADPFEKLIRENPLAALIQARERHVQSVRDYRCTLVKQELLASGMSAEQELDVMHRLEPYSVVITYTRNASLVNRVVYVKGRWTDPDADNPDERELAVAQPGAVAQLLIKSLKTPIHGPMSKEATRRAVDEFGFKRTLDLLIKYCEMARARGELRLEFCGETHFDGRPVWVVRRNLPYTGEGGIYPDRTAEMYIDKEYRVPIAVYCYSDDERKPLNLLGKYEYRDIRFDVGFSESDFDPATYGM
ncbi:MAG TPA: DUF1571 domain-containing protein [Phycisphaerae bacterium]|nr:DUF1571 domain-containing protein [Phycisphaerae bacterium]